ncbi:MAG: DUF4129 domain-containing protein [Capnocytophaga sp.]|nr:DUF4129 domain-containing protein [Capnocytophaga sp.]
MAYAGMLTAQVDEVPVDSTFVDTVVEYAEPNRLEGYHAVDSLLQIKPHTSSVLHGKEFRDGFKRNYTGEEFDYERSQPRESALERIRKKINHWIHSVLGNIPKLYSSESGWLLMRLVAIVISGAAVYFIVRFLLDKNGRWFFGKKNKKTNPLDISDLAENIHEIDFGKAIRESETKNDYRSAIRFRFLLMLKTLSDKKIITWTMEKTNREYAFEIRESETKSGFQRLARIFEYAWYGEFGIRESEYEKHKNEFENFMDGLR